MTPWIIIGWFLVFWVAISIIQAFGPLIVGLIRDLWHDHRLRRAHKGKVRCEAEGCRNKAIRSTPRGFFCERHWYDASRFGGIQYAFPLKYTQEDK